MTLPLVLSRQDYCLEYVNSSNTFGKEIAAIGQQPITCFSWRQGFPNYRFTAVALFPQISKLKNV